MCTPVPHQKDDSRIGCGFLESPLSDVSDAMIPMLWNLLKLIAVSGYVLHLFMMPVLCVPVAHICVITVAVVIDTLDLYVAALQALLSVSCCFDVFNHNMLDPHSLPL